MIDDPRDTYALLESASAAIDLLAERGYDATSVDDIAAALEVSRSTFFRRFRTKEDVVFIDHAYLLQRLAGVLDDGATDPFAAVNSGCMMVFDHHVSRPAQTLRRRDLLRSTFSLRERELVMSHRYERVFTTYLEAKLPAGHPAWVVSAYAAAAVALNNEALRAWFDEQSGRVATRLDADLGALAATFRSFSNAPPSAASTAPPRVVVAVFDSAAPADDVLASIREALGT